MMFEWDEIIESFFDKNQPKSPLGVILIELNELEQGRSQLARLMLLISLIDLLSQYCAGSLNPKGSAKRFVQFSSSFLGLTKDDSELFYQVRNAVIHNQGAFAFNPSNKKQYRFTYGSEPNLFNRKGGSMFEVSVPRLEELTLGAVEAFRNHLEKQEEAREAFLRVYKQRGQLPH